VQVETFCNITQTKLLNKPSIKFVTNFTTNINKVGEGSLFVAVQKSDITQAVANGAYAIVCQTIEIEDSKQDEDIAWIKAHNLKDVCIKLKRFQLNSKNIAGFYCDDITLNIFSTMIKKNNKIKFLSGNIIDDFDHIDIKSSITIYIASEESYINKLMSQHKAINQGDINDTTDLICHSLFETSFIYNSYNFDKIRLPYIYLKQFLNIFEFIKTQHLNDIKVDISMLKHLNIFWPIFIDTRLHIAEFGKTNNFLLANKDMKIYSSQLEYIKKDFKYLKLNIIDGFDSFDEVIDNIDIDKNINYIIGLSNEELKNILNQRKQLCQKSSLF